MKLSALTTNRGPLSGAGAGVQTGRPVDLGNYLRARLIWLVRPRWMLMKFDRQFNRTMPFGDKHAMGLGSTVERRIQSFDRCNFYGEPFEASSLNLEIDAVTPRLIVMRIVRWGRLVTGETVDCLADFRFVLDRRIRCLVCWNDENDIYDPRRPPPPVEPRDDWVVQQPVTPPMLRRLASRSSQIIVVGGAYHFPFAGLSEDGRLTTGCMEKGESENMTIGQR